MNALVYVDIDQGIYKGKSIVARNEKRKKLHWFSYTYYIANFEAFRWNISLTDKPLISEECAIEVEMI